MVSARPLPPYIKLSLAKLLSLGTARWPRFAIWTDLKPSGRWHTVNTIRHLKRAGYIENITPPYKEGEPYAGPRYPVYRLTKLGARAAISGNCERE